MTTDLVLVALRLHRTGAVKPGSPLGVQGPYPGPRPRSVARQPEAWLVFNLSERSTTTKDDPSHGDDGNSLLDLRTGG